MAVRYSGCRWRGALGAPTPLDNRGLGLFNKIEASVNLARGAMMMRQFGSGHITPQIARFLRRYR
jgi:hypothetical protein